MKIVFESQALATAITPVERTVARAEDDVGQPFVALQCPTAGNDVDVRIASANGKWTVDARTTALTAESGNILLRSGILSAIANGTSAPLISLESNGKVCAVDAGSDRFTLTQLEPEVVCDCNGSPASADTTAEFDADEFSVAGGIARKFTAKAKEYRAQLKGVNMLLGDNALDICASDGSRMAQLIVCTSSLTGDAAPDFTVAPDAFDCVIELVKGATKDLEDDEQAIASIETLNGGQIVRFSVGNFSLETSVFAEKYPRDAIRQMMPEYAPKNAFVMDRKALADAVNLAASCADGVVEFDTANKGVLAVGTSDQHGNTACVHVKTAAGAGAMEMEYDLGCVQSAVRAIRADDQIAMCALDDVKNVLFMCGASDPAACRVAIAPVSHR